MELNGPGGAERRFSGSAIFVCLVVRSIEVCQNASGLLKRGSRARIMRLGLLHPSSRSRRIKIRKDNIVMGSASSGDAIKSISHWGTLSQRGGTTSAAKKMTEEFGSLTF